MVSFLGTKVKAVQAGLHHFLALTTGGELYAWGDNSQCQLGLDDPDRLYPPNNFSSEPAAISTAEKPSDALDGVKRANSAGNITMRTSNYQGSAESTYTELEDHEVVWELEEGVQTRPQQSEGPTIDFSSLTRTTQKMKQVPPVQTWRKVLKYSKVPYKVHTDKQSTFGP